MHGTQHPHATDLTAEPPKLLGRMRYVLRTKHYSYRTEQAYVDWAIGSAH